MNLSALKLVSSISEKKLKELKSNECFKHFFIFNPDPWGDDPI